MSALGARAVSRLRHWAGIDGAVGYTALARACSIVSSVGTVLLLVKFLGPVEQGYYYTLLSLVLLQSVFELGFSFVIQQYAAHESVLCTFLSDGRVGGDPAAHSRLASVFQLAAKWYLGASIAIAGILLPIGFVFFSHRSEAHGHVAWQGPWIAVVLATAASFLVAPIYSFLDGCGQIKQVAQARFSQAGVVLVASWGTMICGHGLYAPAMVSVGVVSVAIAFLFPRRRFLLGLSRYSWQGKTVSWRYEIWPFQWKLAVSWFCTYFITQMFTPVLFLARGPIEAGRMGMSINIVAYLPVLVLSWISTKATPFGQLIKLGQLDELDRLFFRTFRQALSLLLMMIVACMAGVITLRYIAPRLAMRMETPIIFAFLLATAISTFSVQSMAVYLRSFKEEPFLIQSVVIFSVTSIGVIVAAPRWGSLGIAVCYFLFSGTAGLAAAAAIFRAKRRLRRSAVLKLTKDQSTIARIDSEALLATPLPGRAVEGA
jgi:O-antigen/teichoic acid export membrane protein